MRLRQSLLLTGVGLACFSAGFWFGRSSTQRSQTEPILALRSENQSNASGETVDTLAFAGPPLSQAGAEATVLRSQAYVVGYSEERRCPLWAAYRLFRIDQALSYRPRDSLRIDGRTKGKVKSDDYLNSGYDRGHLAPNHAIATRFGEDVAYETYMMTNICPQSPYLNRRVWKMLERKVSEDWANRFENIWVITGPIYPDVPEKLPSGVHIPAEFYKIIVTENPEEKKPRMIAFVVPQTARSFRLDSYLSTVDEIEKRTGLDFFALLEDELEEFLESTGPDENWDLKGFNPDWLLPPIPNP